MFKVSVDLKVNFFNFDYVFVFPEPRNVYTHMKPLINGFLDLEGLRNGSTFTTPLCLTAFYTKNWPNVPYSFWETVYPS